jgi:hypothetical protein
MEKEASYNEHSEIPHVDVSLLAAFDNESIGG